MLQLQINNRVALSFCNRPSIHYLSHWVRIINAMTSYMLCDYG